MKAFNQNLLITLALLAGIHQAVAQNLFEADLNSGNIYEFTNGVAAEKGTFASGLSGPIGLAFNSAGNLFELDSGSGNIYEFTNNAGTLSSNYVTFASGLNSPRGLASDNHGNLFVANTGGHNVLEFTNNAGVLSTNYVIFASGLNGPLAFAFNSAGNLLVADSGTISTLATIYEYTSLGAQSTVASVPTQPFGLAFDSAGDLFVSDVGGNGPNEGDIYEFTNNAGTLSSNRVTFAFGLYFPEGLAFDSAGNLFEADGGSGNIFEFTNGVAAEKGTFASGLNHPSGLAFSAIVTNSTPPVPFTYTTNNGAIIITGYTGTNIVVTIPGTINGLPVTGIGGSAFYVSDITSVTIPQSVTNIEEFAFEPCFDLTNITVVADNPDYSSVNGIVFDKNQTTLIAFPGGIGGTYTIPNSVNTIADGAFYGCIALENVIVPSSVGSIGVDAFVNDGALTNITIGIGVTNIEGGAFFFCTGLESVNFQGNAPAQAGSVFQNDASAIAYYLQGATGWGATFDGIPTSVILPPAPALGISTYGSQPAVFFPTATGTNYMLQMTTNLAPPVNWVTVTNGTAISGIIITNPPAAAFFRLH